MRRVVLITAALLAPACDGGPADPVSTPTARRFPEPESSEVLTMRDDDFDPAHWGVPAGRREYEVRNEGTTTHNLTIDAEDISVDVPAGESATVVLDVVPGVLPMYCSFHGEQGMVGTLQVFAI